MGTLAVSEDLNEIASGATLFVMINTTFRTEYIVIWQSQLVTP